MSDLTERIFNLDPEDDIQNAVIMSDLTGRPRAKKKPLNLFALKTETCITELTGNEYKDLNYAGYALLNGCWFFSVLGSELVNAPFSPVPANTYLVVMQIGNIDTKIHKIEYFIQSSGVDFGNKNKYFVRMGISLALAITARYTDYTISPFAYVSGSREFQVIDNNDYSNNTDDYMVTALSQVLNELSPTSTLRFDFNGYIQGQTNSTGIQFRLMQNDNLLDETIVFPVGTTKQAINYNFYLPVRFPENPSTFRVDFKNVSGNVNLLGSEKGSTMYLTETYQTTR